MVYTYNGILFSHEKKEILPFAATWIVLEDIMLSEISRTEKDKYCMTSTLFLCVAGNAVRTLQTREESCSEKE